jgi:transcriptional regulator with XRE-family HTH domain
MTVTTVTVTTATERLGVSILRIRLGAALQKHRVQRGLTQAELAEFADLSLKYVGEIERGEANTTLEVLERLAAAVQWNPMDALEGMREPLSEGVRMLLLDEVAQLLERLKNMSKWLQALDPALQIKAARRLEPHDDRRLKGARPSRKARRQRREQQQQEQEQPPQEPPPEQPPD